MRRSRLLLCALLNALALLIVGWSFIGRTSLANLLGLAAMGLFVASFLLFRRERRRASAAKSTPD